MKVVALDDEPHALELIKRFSGQAGLATSLELFTRPMEAIRYINQHSADLLLLDINMPGISGLEFRKQLPTSVMVIFATAYSEHAAEGFNLNALDYLLKPFSFDRFAAAMHKAHARYTYTHSPVTPLEEYISLRVNYALVKIPLEKILYVEGMNDYIRVYLEDQSPVLSRTTLKALEDKLPPTSFMRIHRSYIIPINKIQAARHRTVTIGRQQLPVGLAYEEKFSEMLGRQKNEMHHSSSAEYK